MTEFTPDIVIFGAGIAGLWSFHKLNQEGYDVVLLTDKGIGHGQTLASQGIIHSGLKYTLAGNVSALAKSISAMPNRWRSAIHARGEIDLSNAQVSADTQMMLIPKGFMGGIVKVVAEKALGDAAQNIPAEQWPEELKNSGFNGSAIRMGEPVLNIETVIRALAEPYQDRVFQIDPENIAFQQNEHGEVTSFACGDTEFKPQQIIFTAASANLRIAKSLGHHQNLETQHRPLLMSIMKNAPFPLYAHLIGTSEKPVATITTHEHEDGSLVWYFGGQVSERAKDSSAEDTITACKETLKKYMPNVDVSSCAWATLPIDRVEGKSGSAGFMPDTPTLHHHGNVTYAWPTKLTFAPLLSDKLTEHLHAQGCVSKASVNDYASCTLPRAVYAKTPWNEHIWSDQ